MKVWCNKEKENREIISEFVSTFPRNVLAKFHRTSQVDSGVLVDLDELLKKCLPDNLPTWLLLELMSEQQNDLLSKCIIDPYHVLSVCYKVIFEFYQINLD